MLQAEEMLQEKRKERERARRIRLQELEKMQREVSVIGTRFVHAGPTAMVMH